MTSTTITSRLRRRVALALLLVLGAGCGTAGVGALRFYNHEPIRSVDDRQPIAKPATRHPHDLTYDVSAIASKPVVSALEFPERPAAMNVNSLGEVPDSSWFENRIGVRALSAAQLARGPNRGEPDRSRPWSVREAVRTRSGSRLVIEDARGDRYILKFDWRSQPEVESGADMVGQRLLWAAGYNVPENSIAYVRRSDLIVDLEAKRAGGRTTLTERDVDAMLASAPRAGAGGYLRALASRYLEGAPLGGYASTGMRPDDPNDRVPHEHRRDVRGQRLFFAWLGHTDVKEENTLDMWVEQPRGSGRGHVVHYLVDFGKSFGAWAKRGLHRHDGYAPHFDYADAALSLTTLGIWRRPWEAVRAPDLHGIGRYEAEHFDPDGYAPASFYGPFAFTDRFDEFWAAKIIARFRPEHIAAAVQAAEYSDPLASVYLVATILARQRKILRSAFSSVNPIDGVRVAASGRGLLLCASDLLLAHRLAAPAETHYLLETFDYAGDSLGTRVQLRASQGGELCAGPLAAGATHSGYTLVVIRTYRGEQELAPVIAHVARKPGTGTWRVIGIERR